MNTHLRIIHHLGAKPAMLVKPPPREIGGEPEHPSSPCALTPTEFHPSPSSSLSLLRRLVFNVSRNSTLLLNTL